MKDIVLCGEYSKEKFNFHQHEDYEIIYYSSGKGKINIGEKIFQVEKGNVIIMPPFTKHGSISQENLRYVSLLGNAGGLIRTKTPTILKDNEKGDGYSLLQMILENRYDNTEFANALSIAFKHFVIKNIDFTTQIELTIDKIRNTIINNFYDTTLDVTELLKNSGYAEDYVRAQFKKLVGKSPIGFLTEIRIKNAVNLIKIYGNSLPLTEIATSCGFDDYIYFSRQFKKLLGSCPQEYKKSI
ncbi:MAG: helix-turn-helix domain-containing protein [Clostridia bacterium]|nr:helix-turn-helix domain-containing protein [Clostridia bacterium]